jgi:quercetin dioxygenase-like cupin family protein
MRSATASWFALQLFAAPSFAAEPPAVTQLLSTQVTVSGQPIVLPQPDVQLIVSRFVIAPGATLPVHEHPAQRYAHVLAGHPRVR